MLGILEELLKLFNTIRGQYNDPALVQNKINQVHQDLKDHNARLSATLQKPDLTAAEKLKALDAIRLIDS